MSDTYHAPEPYRAWAKGDEYHGGPWHVYILDTDAGHYIGHTGNLERRIGEHERGQHKATRGFRPTLVWATEQPSREEATLLEATLKSLRDQRADTFEAMTGIKPIPLVSHEEMIDRLRSAWKEQHDLIQAQKELIDQLRSEREEQRNIVQKQNDVIEILREFNDKLQKQSEVYGELLEKSYTHRVSDAVHDRLIEGWKNDFPFSDKFRDRVNMALDAGANVGDILGFLIELLYTVFQVYFPHFTADDELLNQISAALIDGSNVGCTIGVLIHRITLIDDLNKSNGILDISKWGEWHDLDPSEQDEALIEFWKGNRSAEDYA